MLNLREWLRGQGRGSCRLQNSGVRSNFSIVNRIVIAAFFELLFRMIRIINPQRRTRPAQHIDKSCFLNCGLANLQLTRMWPKDSRVEFH